MKVITVFPKRVTITSALPYVNGVKHLGNITGSLLPADVFHRFLDIFGVDNIFICGTDDHGTAVELAAAEEGLTPAAYSEKYYKIQKEIYKKWNFDFTFFGRTSSPSNHKITQDLFLSAHENVYIKGDTIVIPYCRQCRRFLPDRYIYGTCPSCGNEKARGDQCEKCSRLLNPDELLDAKCTICGHNEIEFRQEKHLFLDLPMLQGRLEEWIKQQTHWPENTRSLAMGWLKEGLKPRCITRNLTWGVKVPLEHYGNLVFYVWFDAPIGYISMTKDAHDAGLIKDWKSYWRDSSVYQFVGKDNIPFHTIIWPSALLAARDSEQRDTNYQLVHHVAGYEYLNWGGEKFSTSKGIGLLSDEALDFFPVDYWRFYLSSILPENKDSNFDWGDFQNRINSELIGNYGNLFYRATYFIEKNFEGRVPTPDIGEAERKLQWELEKTIEKVKELVEQAKLREALKETLALASLVNAYFQHRTPWAAEKQAAATVLYTTINVLRPLSLLLSPYIPESAAKAIECLGGNRQLTDKFLIESGQLIKAQLLFKKIEDSEIEKVKKYRSKYSKHKETTVGGNKNAPDALVLVDDMLPFNEFAKVDMRVGTIVDVKDHPNADKLYVLQVDLGDEQRQIVAGLRQKYKKEQLEDQQVIIVTNLEPKELRGVQSHGMLLAAGDGTILQPAAGVPNGAKIR